MKLKDIIDQLKYRIVAKKETIRSDIINQVYNEQRRKKTFFQIALGSAAALLILSSIGVYFYNYFTLNTSNNITGDISALSPIVYVAANNTINDSVTTDTTLSIVTKESMSTQEIKECISITPNIPYSIKKKGINRFTLIFDEPLKNNTSYIVNAVNENKILYRWSLQTEADFEITNAYPADSQEIDINTTIEVTFTESSVNAFGEFFTIEPKVNGSFKHNGRTWIFIPSQPLSPYTNYTITISGDIAGQYEKTLGENYVFSFTTGASEDKWAYVANKTFDIADTFASNVSPYVSICANGMRSTNADMTVYRLNDADAYLKLHSKYNKNSIISSAIAQDITNAGLAVYSKFSVSAVPDPENNQLYYFNYPKELESGYYITEINWNGVKLFQLLQVSDLAVYAAAHDGTYIVWVNNIRSGAPVKNAVVEISKKSVKTNNNGIATLTPNINKSDSVFITVKSDSLLPHIICAQYSTEQSSSAFSDYYSYLYTNSTIYHSTDTVRIWGAVLNRNQRAKSPSVTLYAGWNDTEYPVELDSKGTFTAEIPIDDYKLTQSNQLCLRVNNYDHFQKFLTIVDYEPPAYSLSMHTDKNAYFAGETANFNIDAAYYNGLPVSSLNLTDNKNILLSTDQYGNAKHSTIATVDQELLKQSLNSCDPQTYWQYIKVDPATGDTTFAKTPFLVFENNEYLQVDVSKQVQRYTLEIKTNKIVTDPINALSNTEFLSKYKNLPKELYLGDHVDKEVTLEVHEITYERTQIGSYYDPIQKKLQQQYKYTQNDSIIKSDTFRTKDGTATLKDYAIPSSQGARYIKLTMKDAANKDCFAIVYIDQIFTEETDQYKFSGIEHKAKQDKKFKLRVYNPEIKQHMDGEFIYLAVGDGHFEANSSENATAEFIFDESCFPDVTLFGAYFDGTTLHPVTEHNISADLTNKKINVSLSADKTQYAPGENVTIDITTTDYKGKPISADLNVNVIDKALLSVADNDIDILSDLYSSRAPRSIYTSLPIQYYGEDGGSGETIRKDFEDSPAFIRQKTDKDGKATVTFTLPDSLTCWNICALAVTEDVSAGASQIEIISTKKLFISAQVDNTGKSSDDAVISYRCDGTALKEDGALQGNLTLRTKDTLIIEQAINPIAKKQQFVNLGNLKNGKYILQLDVTDGVTKDSVEYPIEIVNAELSVNAVCNLDVGLQGSRNLLFTDSQYDRYSQLLDMLLNGGSVRLDHTIGEKYAIALSEQFDSVAYKKIDWSFLNDYCLDGGYAPYTTNSNSDLFLTSRIVSLLPQEIDREYALEYFNSVLGNEKATLDDIICSLWGKAALYEAVEKDLNYYYADGNIFSLEQQLCFALGYAYNGNQTKANEIFEKHISPNLVRNAKYVYIVDKDTALMERCNNMLALLTSRISSKETDKVFSYLIDHAAETGIPALEIISYLSDYIPYLEGKNSARITFGDGTSQEVEYVRYAPYVLPIEANQEGKIKVESLNGTTSVKTNGTLNADSIIKNGKKLGTISCVVASEVKIGQQIPIYLSVDPKTIKGNKINVVLPTGIRFLKNYSVSNNTAYVATSANPDVLTVYFSDTDVVDITLQCKAVIPGNFVLEPMICIADGNLAYYATDAFPITISETIA